MHAIGAGQGAITKDNHKYSTTYFLTKSKLANKLFARQKTDG